MVQLKQLMVLGLVISLALISGCGEPEDKSGSDKILKDYYKPYS